jgi:hypothetical protein
MKRVSFYAKTNRSGNVLHIEADGCVVSIEVGLADRDGRRVTRVDVLPDDESRGGDGHGVVWHLDGSRVIAQTEADLEAQEEAAVLAERKRAHGGQS